MSYREFDESIFNVPYMPIENEPMGRDYHPYDYPKSQYNYIPLTYKTDSTSYMDSWNAVDEYFSNKIPKKEFMEIAPTTNKTENKPENKTENNADKVIRRINDNSFLLLVVFIFIIIILFAYMHYKQTEHIQALIELLLKKEKI